MSNTKKIEPELLKLVMTNHFEINDFFEEEDITEDLIKKWNIWCFQEYEDHHVEDYMDTYDHWYDYNILNRIGEKIKETDSSNYDEDFG